MSVPLSKRYSTWTNIIAIISGAVLVYAPEIVGHENLPYVMLGCTIINGIAQAIKQGKLDA